MLTSTYLWFEAIVAIAILVGSRNVSAVGTTEVLRRCFGVSESADPTPYNRNLAARTATAPQPCARLAGLIQCSGVNALFCSADSVGDDFFGGASCAFEPAVDKRLSRDAETKAFRPVRLAGHS